LIRLPLLKYDEMSLEQQGLHDEILSGPRSRIVGPMHAWFLNPSYGTLIQKVGAFCRFGTSLPPKLSELAIIVVARHWNANVEWYSHSKIALEKGITKKTINAIENDQRPDFDHADEELIYDITKSILETKGLSDALFKQAEEELGKKTLLELTAIIGYYCNVAIQLNVFEIPTEDGSTLKAIS
jgi:4-carboxymuconolactone decarboxylase